MTFWKLCCSQRCLGSLYAQDRRNQWLYVSTPCRWLVEDEDRYQTQPTQPSASLVLVQGEVPEFLGHWTLEKPQCWRVVDLPHFREASEKQKRWDHQSPCKELIDPGTDDESCELQVFEVKLTQNYVAPLKSRSYKLKCTFPPRNNDGSVETDSSFFF